MKLYKILLFSALVYFFASCSDNPSNPQPQTPAVSDNGFFPMTKGSYWINQVVDVDSLIYSYYKPTIDSIVITGDFNKLGRLGKIFKSYSTNGYGDKSQSEAYYSVDSSKVFLHSDYFKKMIAGYEDFLPIKVEDQWMKIADDDDDLWKVFEQDIPETTMVVITIKGSLAVYGSKEKSENITIGGNQFTAKVFVIKIIFTGTVVVPGIGTVPVQFTRKIYQKFVDNIGLVERISDSASVPIPIIGDITFPRIEEKLIRYNINK